MQLKIFKNHNELSEFVADRILELVKTTPEAVICLPSGDTPKLMCSILVDKAAKSRADFSRCTFIGLDEWLGIPPENEGSCAYFFRNNLFHAINFTPANIHLFDALAADPEKECEKMDRIIAARGGIDLMVVGIGMNGHIGFNEPGVSFDNYSHVIDLDETTRSVGRKYFNTPVTLSQGITLGLKHLSETRTVILMANGEKKAAIMKQTLEENISNKIPASIIRTHANGIVAIDEAAAN